MTKEILISKTNLKIFGSELIMSLNSQDSSIYQSNFSNRRLKLRTEIKKNKIVSMLNRLRKVAAATQYFYT